MTGLLRHGPAVVFTTLALVLSGIAIAQNTGVPNALQGFSTNRDKPVHIEAASLDVRDKDKVATFSGNVVVTQGDTNMRCKSLDVFYDQEDGKGAKTSMKAAQPGPGGKQQIRRLEAKGGVVVTQKDQTATGELGIFDMKSNTITLTGGVVVTQGPNVLRGERLIVDVTTGHARVESGGGRVQGLFSPSSKDGLPGSKDKDSKDKDSKAKDSKQETQQGQQAPKSAPGRPQSGLSPLY
jgi:lipopolysaccharide export system protein LptA